jgi:hypothetical protein
MEIEYTSANLMLRRDRPKAPEVSGKVIDFLKADREGD